MKRSKAVKKIPIILRGDDSVHSDNEINVLKRLDSEFVIKYYEWFVEEAFTCIVTEYCEDKDLGDLIKVTKKKNQTLKTKDIFDWFFQIISGLVYIHEKRIIHRDIKPQ